MPFLLVPVLLPREKRLVFSCPCSPSFQTRTGAWLALVALWRHKNKPVNTLARSASWMTPVWGPCPEPYDKYEASMNTGQVRHGTIHRVLAIHDRNNYSMVNVYLSDGSRPHQSVHRLVALTHLADQKAPGCNEIDHRNRDTHDNRAANLEWVTRRQNLANRLLVREDEARPLSDAQACMCDCRKGRSNMQDAAVVLVSCTFLAWDEAVLNCSTPRNVRKLVSATRLHTWGLPG